MAGEDQELVTTLRMRVRSADDTVIQQAVHDSMVITIPIDSSLSVSGAAADALAVGNALGGKANLADVRGLLSVDGRTGNGSWAIILNGGDIPATEDADEESVADALERLALADTALGTRIGTEETARAAADTALGGRIDTEAAARAAADTALEGRVQTQINNVGSFAETVNTRVAGIDTRVTALEGLRLISGVIEFETAGTYGIQDERITADHVLIAYQFYDAAGNATGNILADLVWTTVAGSMSVTCSNIRAAGSVMMIFGVPEDITPEEEEEAGS